MSTFHLELGEKEIERLHAAWSLVQQHERGFAVQFYLELFRRYPELESRFEGSFQRQAAALQSMFDLMMKTLDQPSVLSDRMPRLAEIHQRHGICSEDYDKFGEVLCDTLLAHVLEEDRPGVGAAIRKMYQQLAGYMQTAIA